MGAHIKNLEQPPFNVQLLKSDWRELGVTPVPTRGGFTFFQSEEGLITGWLGYKVRVEHTRNRATVYLQPEPLIAGGLDGTPRSLKRFLTGRRVDNLRGVSIWFTPVSSDTWHYEESGPWKAK